MDYFQGFLKIEKISLDANFFSLGGHSMLAFRAISGLNQLFNIQLPLRILFESPVMKDLVMQIANHMQSSKVFEEIPIASKASHYPLSYVQQHFWFLVQQKPNSALYSIPFVLTITGKLEISCLQRALANIVQRHEILRTILQNDDNAIRQVVFSELNAILEYEDCSKKKNAYEYCKKSIHKTANIPFNLSKGPLFRFKLFQQSGNKYRLLLNFSHLVFDGFSVIPLLNELKYLYESFIRGKTHDLQKLDIQYKDYAVWQNKTFENLSLNRSTMSWLNSLNDAPTVLNLSTDQPRPSQQTYTGATIDFIINEQSIVEKLNTITQNYATTPFVLFLSIFHVLLYKYTNQNDITIGFPTSGRMLKSLTSLIGCFTNVLPVRTISDSHESFIALLHGVKHQVNEALQNERIPFAKILNELQLQRVPGLHPLFQVMFNLLPKIEVNNFQELDFDFKAINCGYSHLDLSISMQETFTGYAGTFEYNTNLFSKAKILQMSEHFQRLIKVIVNNPHAKICEIQVLSENEIQQQVIQWNKQTVVLPGKQSILTQIETWARNIPDAVALVCGKTIYTYEQVNTLANRIAHNLLQSGISAESKVVICMERSIEFIPAVLGILKSGAAYVPIDPKSPEERRIAMMKDLDYSLILTDSRSKKLFPNHKVLCLNKLSKTSVENPDIMYSQNRLAYVIFTSGSTGLPKGVEIEYSSINSRVLWKSAAYPLDSSDVILHTYSFIFDGSIINYLWPLCSGASIVIATQEQLIDCSAILKLIREWKVTTMDMLPYLLEGLVDEDEFHVCTSLKNVFSGGEALYMDLVKAFQKKYSANLHNTYGPTEATVEATAWKCKNDFCGTIAPLGRPIFGAQLYILDKDQNVLPIGVPGELYIGGIGVARGYLNDPKTTREKFIFSPFPDMEGTKLYRTGDLVKYQQDGTILFLGRIDKQVKIRGFRIDPNEIEFTLRTMKEVDSVIVTTRGDSLHKNLVAYVKLHKRVEVTIFNRLMKNFLNQKLPSYMIPQSVVILDAFPTLLNGKINYNALPEPEQLIKKNVANSRLKRLKPLERKLLKMWKKVLDCQDISITDDFFEIGGNSLLAMRLIVNIKYTIGISVPVAKFFLNPTVKKLAQFVHTRNTKHTASPIVVQMSSQGNKAPFFCVHPIGGNILCYNYLVQNWEQDRPFYAIQAHGLEDNQKPKETIKEMAKEYILEMRKTQPHGPYFIGGWSFGGLIAAEMAHQLTKQGEKVSKLILIDSTTKINKLQNVDIHDESALLSELTNHYFAQKMSKKSNLTVKERLARFIDNGGKRAIKKGKTMVDKLVNLAQANYKALQSFSIPKLDVNVVLIRSKLNPEKKSDLGWTNYANELEIFQAPGDHWAITQKKFASNYASLLEDCLSK